MMRGSRGEHGGGGPAGGGEGGNDWTTMTLGITLRAMTEMGWQNGRRGCCPPSLP